MEGWIKLHRQLTENRLWLSEPFTRGQAWVDLLLLSNHEPSFYYKRGNKIDVDRGQIGRSEVELSNRWSWSRTKLRKFLNDLEKEQQIIQHKSTVTLIITIINYEKYQEKEQQAVQQKNSRKTAEEQQKNTYKNDKNEKEGKEKKINGVFIPPSIDEVIQYCKERGNAVDVSTWINFYQSKGWMIGKNKMVDWKSAIITWEKGKSNKTTNGQPKLSI